MINSEYLRFRKGDLVAMALVAALAIAVAVFFFSPDSSEGVTVQIYQNGNLRQTLSLQENISLEITGKYTNVITVTNGAVSITASDCPGEDCVHSGAIQTSGRSIVCLPNEVEVRVVNGQSDVDFVVG